MSYSQLLLQKWRCFIITLYCWAQMSSSGEVIKFMAPGYKMGECRDFKWVSLNRAQNSKPFTFLKLKNPSRGSKVMKGGNTTTWNGCRTKNAKKITQFFQNSWNYCSGKAKHKAAYPRVPASSRRGSRRLLPPTPCSRLSVAALRLDTLAFAWLGWPGDLKSQ